MKFKLDENVPGDAKSLLTQHGHETQTVLEEHLGGQSDDVVSTTASAEGRMLVTLDLDFADERAYPPGAHAGIIVLRLRSHRRQAVVGVLEQLVASQNIEGFAGAIVIVTESTVRIKRA